MARAMKDSGIGWLGAIPADWDVSLLKYAIRWKSEKGHPDESVLSLYRDYGVVPKDSRDDNYNVTSLDTTGYKFVEVNDLVVNKMKAWQGSIAVSDYQGIVSPAYHVCQITSNQVLPRYLHYLLRNPSYLPEYARLSTGLRVGQWDLGFDDFRNLPFLIPPKNEQQRIVLYLDGKCAEIDAVLAKTRASIEEYKKLKQAIITQAVTKGVRGDRPMKDSGIDWVGEMPADWVRCRVKNAVDCHDEWREPVSADKRENKQHLYEYYGASGVIDTIDYYNVDATVLLIGEDGANLRLRNLPLVYRASGRFWVNNHAHILVVKPENNYGYLAYLLEAGDYATFITGTAQPKL